MIIIHEANFYSDFFLYLFCQMFFLGKMYQFQWTEEQTP